MNANEGQRQLNVVSSFASSAAERRYVPVDIGAVRASSNPIQSAAQFCHSSNREIEMFAFGSGSASDSSDTIVIDGSISCLQSSLVAGPSPDRRIDACVKCLPASGEFLCHHDEKS